MTDISGFGFPNDLAFVRHLIERIGIAAVPGSSFFLHPECGSRYVRFCFCKKYETMRIAAHKLRRMRF
jgi:aminotransferase